ncbi:MAG: D-2-hydroxyacid dehydrogenase [Clostridiales Family XIII bacterium]|jgi:D-3-phosphoglycerate dehydrogenase|nr:D-2-hydroxyacid dehydrogenase [Clostridiales Family XIII bacterium]
MIRILATDGIDKASGEKLRELGYELTEQFFGPDDLAGQLKGYDAVIVRSATKIDRPAIDAAVGTGRLKLIVRGGVGTDNIDVDYATKNGIEVCNTPNASSAAVAELAIAHIFTLARHLHEANVTMREGKWEKNAYSGVELAGKTLGLIGLGRIGRCVADKAKALGMDVVYYDIVGRAPGSDNYEYLEVDDLLVRADFISLHIPSYDMAVITADEIAKMKDGVYIVNCARGGLIDEDAMLDALDSGKVAGVGLDVYPEEPPKDERILKHPKISLTPHIGASTAEAQSRIGGEIVSIVSEKFGR